MTCVATDGRLLAADSRSTRDGLIISDQTRKLWRGPDGAAWGFAGDGGAIALARDWVGKGEKPDLIPALRGQDFCGLCLRPDGKLYLIDGLFSPIEIGPPAAIGTGETAALAAMICGASPKRAVQIAAMLRTDVGGPIRTMKPKGGNHGRGQS